MICSMLNSGRDMIDHAAKSAVFSVYKALTQDLQDRLCQEKEANPGIRVLGS